MYFRGCGNKEVFIFGGIFMANKYAGTQTKKNLEAAFAGESQARNKYTYFASRAKKVSLKLHKATFLGSKSGNHKKDRSLWSGLSVNQ